MDLQQIRCAVTVFRTGSFTKAAQQLNITQSWLSQQISSLEKEIGFTLFRRTTRSVMPTEQGEIFCNQGISVINEFEVLKKYGQLRNADDSHTLTVITAPRLSAIDLPLAVSEFYKRNEGAVINYNELEQSEITALAGDRTRIWDAAVLRKMDCPELFGMDGIRSICLLRDPIVVLCHDGHPLRRKQSVSLEELRGYSMVFGSPDTKLYKDFILAVPEEYIREQSIPVFSNSHSMMAELVASGSAIALGNRTLAVHYGLSYVPLEGNMSNDVYLFSKELPDKKILSDFSDHLRKFYQVQL